MQTIYYHLDARRLSMTEGSRRRACGGEETVYAFVPRKPAHTRPMGQLVELSAFRHPPVEEAPVESIPVAEDIPNAQGRSLGLLLDALATAAIVAATAVVVLRFLPL